MKWPFTRLGIEELATEVLTLEHSQAMADIHAKTFKPSWTDGDFQNFLSGKQTGGICMRLPHEHKGIMVGFALVRIVADEAEILTIAVDPAWQAKGVGRRLMDGVLANLHTDGVPSLFLEVDASNEAAIALYKRVGFEQVAVRENYYSCKDNQKAHALVMRRDVG